MEYAGKSVEQEIIDSLPAPGNAIANLRHTIAAYERYGSQPADGELAIHATGGVYGDGVKTGLTWGDLREILRALES